MRDGKTIKGLLICPETKSIKEVDIAFDGDGSCLASMYEVLGCRTVDVGRGGLAYLPSSPKDDVWFDDEGLFSSVEECFLLPDWVPLIGNGLILGYDDEGNSTSHTLTEKDIEVLRNTIRWCKRRV